MKAVQLLTLAAFVLFTGACGKKDLKDVLNGYWKTGGGSYEEFKDGSLTHYDKKDVVGDEHYATMFTYKIEGKKITFFKNNVQDSVYEATSIEQNKVDFKRIDGNTPYSISRMSKEDYFAGK